MKGKRLATAAAGLLLTATIFGAATGPAPRPTPRQEALHVLNRLGYGPRPGDVDRVLRAGIDNYIQEQLHPERLDDSSSAAELSRLDTLSLSNAEIFGRFERPIQELRREYKRQAAQLGTADAEKLRKQLRAQIPPRNRPGLLLQQLEAQKILRAADSRRQLNEVMVDFWTNHFNVYARKGLDNVFLTSFERDVIRPRIWGNFYDLLAATAQSPAMLFYLDNARSIAPPEDRPAPPRRWRRFLRIPPARAGKKNAGGINENYARELMELHTLGVNGGYTQADVIALARILTGWSISRGGKDRGTAGDFLFRARVHDIGAKTFLGRNFPPGHGMDEGLGALKMLAESPSTAHHLAFELCQRLVADNPPASLVDRVTRRYLETGGNLRATVAAVIESPEFFDPRYMANKIKSPFEMAVSAIRATGTAVSPDQISPLAGEIARMGEPLYLCQPPNGFTNNSKDWINTGALIERLNFGLALTANRLPGLETDIDYLLSPDQMRDPRVAVDTLARTLTGEELTPQTRQTIVSHLEELTPPLQDPSADTEIPRIAGLILGSPEFQKE